MSHFIWKIKIFKHQSLLSQLRVERKNYSRWVKCKQVGYSRLFGCRHCWLNNKLGSLEKILNYCKVAEEKVGLQSNLSKRVIVSWSAVHRLKAYSQHSIWPVTLHIKYKWNTETNINTNKCQKACSLPVKGLQSTFSLYRLNCKANTKYIWIQIQRQIQNQISLSKPAIHRLKASSQRSVCVVHNLHRTTATLYPLIEIQFVQF